MTLKDEYNSNYHGLFNKKLATWAVKNMRVKDKSTKEMKPINPRSIEDVEVLLKQNKVNLPDEFNITEHISDAYDVDSKSETSAYLQGEISRKMYEAVALTICPKNK